MRAVKAIEFIIGENPVVMAIKIKALKEERKVYDKALKEESKNWLDFEGSESDQRLANID